MRSSWGQISLLLLAMLTLAGCFRQAGEAYEPETEAIIEPTALPVTVEPQMSPTPELVELEDLPPTSTLPPVTVIAPTRPSFGEPVTLPTVASSVIEPTVQTQGFITPGVPLGPITITPKTDEVTPLSIPPNSNTSALPLIGGTPAATGPECAYTIEAGDTLYNIALSHDFTLDELRAVNPELTGEDPLLNIDQIIALPSCDETPDTVSEDVVGGTTQNITPPDAVAPIPDGSNSSPVTGVTGTTDNPDDSGIVTSGRTHTVAAGDTLYSISRQYGVTVDAIIAANTQTLPDPNRLDVGQVLNIP